MNRVVDCRASRGLSMVELLVALALGLIITAAVLQMFLASKTTYRMQEALARVQENGRFAIGQLANDIRMAGYMGCGNIDRMQVNIIADPPSDYEFSSTDILSGVENFSSSDSWPSSIRRPLNGSDLFEIRRASSAGLKVIPEHTSNANIKVQGDHGFSQHDILFVTDCSSGDVFKVSNNPKGNGQQGTLTHANNVNTDNRLSKLYGGDIQSVATVERPDDGTLQVLFRSSQPSLGRLEGDSLVAIVAGHPLLKGGVLNRADTDHGQQQQEYQADQQRRAALSYGNVHRTSGMELHAQGARLRMVTTVPNTWRRRPSAVTLLPL